ncbi:MAG: glucosyltransferase domain-containing protein [Lachnospiraceae bacterium]|nr:glucosyltransferase domain-containing protein [Lachnospiraceae bacterium]
MIVGMLTHLYMIANKISNWDDLTCPAGVGGGEWHGRWLQPHVYRLFSIWSIPAINGTMAVVLLAFAACFIISALEIRSTAGVALTASVLVTFPAVASNMTFMYISELFSLALLFCAVGVYLTKRFRYGWIAAIFLIMDCMALYQAYFAIAASLFVLMVLLELIDAKGPESGAEAVKAKALRFFDRSEVRSGIKYVLVLGASMAAYLVSLKVSGRELVSYKGMNAIGEQSAGQYLRGIARAYHRVLQYFVTKPESYLEGVPANLNRFAVVVLLALLIWFFITRKVYKNFVSCLLYFFLLFMMPLAMGLIYVMTPTQEHASTVMTYSYVCLYFMIIALAERLGKPEIMAAGASGTSAAGQKNLAEEKSVDGRSYFARALALLAALSVFMISYAHFQITNEAYYRSLLAQERVKVYLSHVMERLEEQEGYEYGDPVIFGGNWAPEKPPIMYRDMDSAKFRDFEGLAVESGFLSLTIRGYFIRYFFGLDVGLPEEEEITAMMARPEYLAMPVYPAQGCIQQIDDTWVVRLAPN